MNDTPNPMQELEQAVLAAQGEVIKLAQPESYSMEVADRLIAAWHRARPLVLAAPELLRNLQDILTTPQFTIVFPASAKYMLDKIAPLLQSLPTPPTDPKLEEYTCQMCMGTGIDPRTSWQPCEHCSGLGVLNTRTKGVK